MTRKQPGAQMFKAITAYTAEDVKATVYNYPNSAQSILEAEYKRHPRPRYALITWLKRHRPHNPTTRVIKTR